MVDAFQLELCKRLTEAPGAPGFEGEVRAIMREYISAYANEIVCDNLGSIFGVKKGADNGPRIMVAGHMDEVGFMVTTIAEKGFLTFQPLGGWWSQVLLAQRVQVITKKGPITGVIGSIPPHGMSDDIRNRPMEIENMFIDVGIDSREEAEMLGIRPGQPVLPICPFLIMANGEKMMAKAWDNRFGCALSIELLKELHSSTDHPNIVYAGATVQEEVGLRGSKTAAALLDPDLFFALEASPAGDIPGDKNGMGKLGEGVLIRLMDSSMIMLPGLRDLLIETCVQEGIPYQFYVGKGGGTDAGSVHLHSKGVPSAVIAIPTRYIHSHAAIIHRDDYNAAKRLLCTLVKRIDHATIEAIRSC